jgi:hypothetical protein
MRPSSTKEQRTPPSGSAEHVTRRAATGDDVLVSGDPKRCKWAVRVAIPKPVEVSKVTLRQW